MRRKKIGEMHLNSTVDITDPCYDKNTWCRINDVKVAEGNYDCIVWRQNKKYGDKTYLLNGIVGIYKDGEIPKFQDMELFGSIGVDAGMVGFFEDKPDYNDEEWQKFCDRLPKNRDNENAVEAWIDKDGFYADTAYGDGCYGVYRHCDENGNADALEIFVM